MFICKKKKENDTYPILSTVYFVDIFSQWLQRTLLRCPSVTLHWNVSSVNLSINLSIVYLGKLHDWYYLTKGRLFDSSFESYSIIFPSVLRMRQWGNVTRATKTTTIIGPFVMIVPRRRVKGQNTECFGLTIEVPEGQKPSNSITVVTHVACPAVSSTVLPPSSSSHKACFLFCFFLVPHRPFFLRAKWMSQPVCFDTTLIACFGLRLRRQLTRSSARTCHDSFSCARHRR